MVRRPYLAHVEGLRGVAALYVFLFHLWQTGVAHAGATLAVLLPLTGWLQYGHFAVAVFIVISGYCLGLPVAAARGRFDAPAFFRRRVRRLAPAYLVALAIALVLVVATDAAAGRTPVPWHLAAELGAHLLLVHNLVAPLAETLNGPMWSIALEAQIYVLFALVLVPVWHRFGVWAQLAVALAAGFAPLAISAGRSAFTFSWLAALFAMGIVAAAATARGGLRGTAWRCGALAAGGLATIVALHFGDGASDASFAGPDLLAGAAVALFFATAGGSAPTRTERILSASPLARLGTFSYSLYLIHAPPVLLVGALLARSAASSANSALAYGTLIPLVLAAAYGLYRIAERPFLSPALRAATTDPGRRSSLAEPALAAAAPG